MSFRTREVGTTRTLVPGPLPPSAAQIPTLMEGAEDLTHRIRDWKKDFENNRTRELKKMDWVPIPNKMDGAGYTELVDHPNGAAHFGAWVAIVEIASRQDNRGTLPHPPAGKPQDTAGLSQVLARISRLPAGIFEEVIPRLIGIGWIECFQSPAEIPHPPAEIPHPPAEIPHPPAEIPHPPAEPSRDTRAVTEGKGREGKGTEGKAESATAISVPSWMADESYVPFVELYRSFRPRVIDEDFANGHQWYWTQLGISQRLEATKNLRARMASGEDGEFVRHMPEYLKSEWKRGPKISNGKNGHGKTDTALLKYERPNGLVTDEVFQRMKQEREERSSR